MKFIAKSKDILSLNLKMAKHLQKASPSYLPVKIMDAVVSTLGNFVQILFYQKLIDRILYTSPPLLEVAVSFFLFYLLCSGIRTLNYWANNIFHAREKAKIERYYKNLIYSEVVKKNLKNYNSEQYLNMLYNAVYNDGSCLYGFEGSICSLVAALIALATVGTLFGRLHFIFVVGAVLAAVKNCICNSRTNKIKYQMHQDNLPFGRAQTYIYNLFYEKRYIRELKLYPIGGYFIRKYKFLKELQWKRNKKQNIRKNAVGLIGEMADVMLHVMNIVVLVYLLLHQRITVGEFSLVLSNFSLLSVYLERLFMFFPNICNHADYIGEIVKILDGEDYDFPKVEDTVEGCGFMENMHMGEDGGFSGVEHTKADCNFRKTVHERADCDFRKTVHEKADCNFRKTVHEKADCDFRKTVHEKADCDFSEITHEESDCMRSMAGAYVKCKDLCFSYDGEHDVLKNINIELPLDKKIAIVGENGSGKSTFIKLLLGLYAPSGGTLEYHCPGAAGKDSRVLFGTMLQDYRVFAMSVRDNVCPESRLDSGAEKDLPDGKRKTLKAGNGKQNGLNFLDKQNETLDAANEKNKGLDITEKVRESMFWEAVSFAGLQEKIEKLPDGEDTVLTGEFLEEGVTLSGGEQQKLAIARAYAKKHPVLILDEPSANLDPVAENALIGKINQLAKGRGVVLVTHNLAYTKHVDLVCVLEEGEIVEYGAPKELMGRRGKYEGMVRVWGG